MFGKAPKCDFESSFSTYFLSGLTRYKYWNQLSFLVFLKIIITTSMP
jgi:hypothetical protein